MLIVALYCRSLHHTYQVKGTVGSGNTSWIRVFVPEPYRTVLTRTAQWKHKLDQGVRSRTVPYRTDPYSSVETRHNVNTHTT